METWDYKLKLLLVGESGVGKSNLLLRYTENTYSDSFISTIGVDFKMKNIILNDRMVKLQLWDTAGQERYRAIVASFYKGAHGIVVVFDLTDINSFLKVKFWLQEIKQKAPEKTSIILVGNKKDLEEQRMVDEKEVKQFADTNNLQYFETSAKTGEGVEPSFVALAQLCLKVVVDGGLGNSPTPGLPEGSGGGGGCCRG